MNRIDILGVKIDNLSFREVADRAKFFLNSEKSHYMVTCNPEIVFQAQKDEYFKSVLNSASVSVPDGFGLLLVSKILENPLRERVVGTDFLEYFCGICEKEDKSVFFLGGKKDVAKKTAEKLKNKYADLKIAGSLDGYADIENCFEIIKSATPAVLFVALGAPKQEKWIYENLPKLNSVKLAVGVGGAFDFISGSVKRAPKPMRQIGFEWLWRLAMQPRRIKRIFNAVAVFPILFFADFIKNKARN